MNAEICVEAIIYFILYNSRKSPTFDLQWLRAPVDWILEDDKEKSIHQKNTKLLAIKIYKFQAGLTPPIMRDLFVTKENKYNIRNFQVLEFSTNSKIWSRNYFQQGTSNMEPDSFFTVIIIQMKDQISWTS